MLNITQPEDTNTSNILKGFTIFLSICPKTKIISHSGAIDVVLMNNTYTQEDINSLVLLGWEELSDYSWRYWLEKKISPWITLAGKYKNDESWEEVMEFIAQDRKELEDKKKEDEYWEKHDLDKYYDEAYQIVEERMYDQ